MLYGQKIETTGMTGALFRGPLPRVTVGGISWMPQIDILTTRYSDKPEFCNGLKRGTNGEYVGTYTEIIATPRAF